MQQYLYLHLHFFDSFDMIQNYFNSPNFHKWRAMLYELDYHLISYKIDKAFRLIHMRTEFVMYTKQEIPYLFVYEHEHKPSRPGLQGNDVKMSLHFGPHIICNQDYVSMRNLNSVCSSKEKQIF